MALTTDEPLSFSIKSRRDDRKDSFGVVRQNANITFVSVLHRSSLQDSESPQSGSRARATGYNLWFDSS